MTDNNALVRTNGETQALELWAPAEVCAALDWTRHRLKLARDGEGFPEPLAVVAAGAVAIWDAADVRTWYVETQPQIRTQAWRREEAVRMYRRGVKIAAISRQLQAKSDSIRRWLRAAGEKTPRERQETQAL